MDAKPKVNAIVEDVVKTYIQNKGKPAISILLNHHTNYFSDVSKTVTDLFSEYDVTLLVDKGWHPQLPQLCKLPFIALEKVRQEELKNIIDKTALLVIPVASFGLLSKLAFIIDDDLPSWIAIQYQLQGKPIIIANNDVELNVHQQIFTPYKIQERIHSYIQQIQTDLVKLVPLHTLVNTVLEQYTSYRQKQTLILAKHIKKAFQDGLKQIHIPENSQITPLAKDLAKELMIHLNRDGGVS